MHEFKHGELDKRDGQPVKNSWQAIAIALHEAGASNQESPKKNREALRKTKRNERDGRTAQARTEGNASDGRQGTSRAELYAEAKAKNLPGRSKMKKAELERALA